MRRRELNVVRKKKFDVRVCILYPSTYRASLSSLGLQVLYYALNELDRVYAERAVNEGEVVRSIETGTELGKFDAILVTATYELDYPKIYGIFARSGIHPRREMRRQSDPLIIIGGPSPTADPRPLYHVADVVFRGEGERLVEVLVDALLSSRDKRERLEALSVARGAWVPELKEEAEIEVVEDLGEAFHPIEQIQCLDEEPIWGRAFMLEPSRGCHRSCWFCLEGSITKPRRERPFEKLLELIEVGPRVNRVGKVAIYALSLFASHRGEELLEYVVEQGLQASVPSCSVDTLNERRLELIKAAGQRLVTIAPETPVPELQRAIGKVTPEDSLISVARTASSLGLNIKLYYMFGLPGEEERDLLEIVKQVREVYEIFGRDPKRVRVSLNPFVPKPATALRRAQMDSPSSLKRKARFLMNSLRTLARVEVYGIEHAHIQHRINSMGRGAIFLMERLAGVELKESEELRVFEELGGRPD